MSQGSCEWDDRAMEVLLWNGYGAGAELEEDYGLWLFCQKVKASFSEFLLIYSTLLSVF